MKKLFYVLLTSFMFVSCSQQKVNIKTEYDDLSKLLNHCEGYAIVNTTSFNSKAYSYKQHTFVIVDSTNTYRTYYGTNFDIEKGDTIFYNEEIKLKIE